MSTVNRIRTAGKAFDFPEKSFVGLNPISVSY
jgi:hypothetical protein